VKSIYSTTLHDTPSSWMTWYFNDIQHSVPGDFFKKDIYNLNFTISASTEAKFNDVDDFRQEMERSVEKLIINAKGKKIALMLSGIDSEIIGILLKKRNIDFEVWHLNIPHKKQEDHDTLVEIAKGWRVPLNLINFSWIEFRDEWKQNLNNIGILATMMYSIWYAIDRIPSDHFVVVGNGAFRKKGNRFKRMSSRIREHRGRAIPIDGRDILSRIIAQRKKRDGEFYFHSSSDRQVAALFKDTRMIYNQDTYEIDDKEVILQHFPEAKFRWKTEPWSQNNSIFRRERILVLVLEKWMKKKFPNWNKNDQHFYSPLYVDEIFA
jgi:hypothetical protein